MGGTVGRGPRIVTGCTTKITIFHLVLVCPFFLEGITEVNNTVNRKEKLLSVKTTTTEPWWYTVFPPYSSHLPKIFPQPKQTGAAYLRTMWASRVLQRREVRRKVETWTWRNSNRLWRLCACLTSGFTDYWLKFIFGLRATKRIHMNEESSRIRREYSRGHHFPLIELVLCI